MNKRVMSVAKLLGTSNLSRRRLSAPSAPSLEKIDFFGTSGIRVVERFQESLS